MESISKENVVKEEKKISRAFQFIKNHTGTILKVILYVILVALFIQYYLRDYVAEYFKHRSTFTSVTKYQYMLPLPNIIICTDPSFKPSMTEKYGYSFASQLWNDQNETYKKFYLTPWDTYQKLSYQIKKSVSALAEFSPP